MGMEDLKKVIHDLKESSVTKEKALDALKVALTKSMATARRTGFSFNGGTLGIGPHWFTKASASGTELEFQKRADDLYLLGALLEVNPRQTRLFTEYAKDEEFLKAMDTTEHADWVPTQLSANLQEQVHLALKVAALHDRLPMPSQPYDLPYVAGKTTGYLAGEAVAEDSPRIKKSKMTAAKVRFDAAKIAARVILTEELVEDSIIPALPLLKKDIVESIATSVETATINGDTTATHQDTGETVESWDARRAWMGYRKLSQTALDMAGTLTHTQLKVLRGLMGVYGVNPNKLALVVSMAGYLKLTDLEQVKTLDKYGPKATVITGELAKVDNIPVIVSEWARDDLNADGIYDGLVETFTQLLLVYRGAMLYGDRRNVTVKTDFDIERDQNILVATQRLAFSRVFASGDTFIARGYECAKI